MRVLWFEVTPPSSYNEQKTPIGGWQDSLERIVRTIPNIQLGVVFMSSDGTCPNKVIDGVSYFPIDGRLSFNEKIFRRYWDVYVEKALRFSSQIIQEFKPDIIHVFGTEYPFGQVQSITEIPVIIHIMGAIIPYNNAALPPNYSQFDRIRNSGLNPRKIFSFMKNCSNIKNREEWEKKTWSLVPNYMGRTNWDKAVASILHPECKYFHVEEALRPIFVDNHAKWNGCNNSKLVLLSTGCGTFWKGPDLMLKVAKILKDLNIDFEWNIAGQMDKEVKDIVERKERTCFDELNIRILGFVQPNKLSELLCSCSIFVHTAYIENSPNSICEAQIIGAPIVSTNVGGISSLVQDGVHGFLVPANDPWQMAYSIIKLNEDKDLMKEFSYNSHNMAYKRHSADNIREELLLAYNCVINNKKN